MLRSDGDKHPRGRQRLAALLPADDQALDQLFASLKCFLVRHAMGVNQIAPLWQAHDEYLILV